MKSVTIVLQILFLLIAWGCPSPVNAISIEGTAPLIIKKEYLEILPHGRTTGSILENWLTPIVFLQVETGGLSRVDPLRFSNRGISWIEQNWLLNGVDITDPFGSGFPLLEPAWDSIEKMEISSSQENDPQRLGLNWTVDLPESKEQFQTSYHFILPAGDELLIPGGKLDREPSFPTGSPKERRRYKYSSELNGSYHTTDRHYLGIETLITERIFPTLTDESGSFINEKAEKFKLTSIYKNNNTAIPYKALLLAQYNQNNNYGANLRLNHNDTLDQKNLALHVQYTAIKKLSKGELEVRSGITTRFEELEPHLEKPRVIEFDSESGPVPEAGTRNRINFDNSLAYKYGVLNIDGGIQITGLHFKPEIPFLQTLQTVNGETFSATMWDETENAKEYVYNSRIKSEITKTWNSLSVLGNIYVDASTAFANGENLLNWFGAGGKILSEYHIKKTGSIISVGALHRPSKLNSNIVSFLDKKRPSGKSYTWTDSNGNGIAEDAEIGTLISTTGGKYHYKDKNLKRPSQDEIFVSIKQGIGKNFSMLLQGAHRIYSDYFIVNYGSYDGSYTITPDGYQLYNKPAGEDKYYLSNYRGRKGFYSGVEIQLLWESEKTYFNLTGTAFMVKGFAPIGNGPDFNDYAVISEETASPNSRINAVGRFDSDRAYIANLLFGYRLTQDLSFGLTFKYRDGEPFSQHIIYRDSNGSPVRVIRNPRAEWDKEGIRYTFSWNIDMRLRYQTRKWDKKLIVLFDIYNLIGSATEILESYRIENNRRSLEAVPPRMIKLTASLLF